MTWGAVAGAAVSVVGGLVTASSQKSANNSASGASDAGSQAAIDLQAEQFNRNQQTQMPWLSAGSASVNKLADLLGVTPDSSYLLSLQPRFADPVAQAAYQKLLSDPINRISTDPNAVASQMEAGWGIKRMTPAELDALNAQKPQSSDYGALLKDFTVDDFHADPGYQFRLDQSKQALERQAAAGGKLYSGKYLKDLNTVVQGTADQAYQDAYNRFNANKQQKYNMLAGVAGTGQSSANQIGSMGQNAANMGQNAIMTNAGNQASLALANGNANASAYTGIANNLGRLASGIDWGGTGGSSGATNFVNGWNSSNYG